MPLSLLYEWQAYAKTKPLIFSHSYKQKRADWNAAMIATVIRNVIAATHYKNPSFMDYSELIYQEAPLQKEKSPSDIYSLFKTAVLMHSNVNKEKKN